MLDLHQEKEALYTSFLKAKDITSPRVLQAFLKVPRERFIPSTLRPYAYDDHPLLIGKGQTISQPTTVLLMTQFLELLPGHKVLEIGTGSGYQAAIISDIIGNKGKVITTEIIEDLYLQGKKNLKNYKNVKVIHTDGSLGYPKEAPYDRVIMTAASPKLPEHLLLQLKKEGILLAPVGDMLSQHMIRVRKGSSPENLGEFIFVPLTGKHGKQ